MFQINIMLPHWLIKKTINTRSGINVDAKSLFIEIGSLINCPIPIKPTADKIVVHLKFDSNE